jgi:hypothetical protein
MHPDSTAGDTDPAGFPSNVLGGRTSGFVAGAGCKRLGRRSQPALCRALVHLEKIGLATDQTWRRERASQNVETVTAITLKRRGCVDTST